MAKIRAREQARQLRIKGHGIRDIARICAVSKSTASYWCRDIALTKGQIQTLAQKRKAAGVGALLRASEQKRMQRVQETQRSKEAGKRDVAKLSERDLFIIGLALYWGEGYKKGNEEFGFTNSDPDIIRVYLQWLERIYNVSKEDLVLRVSINDIHAYRVDNVIRFWEKETGVNRKQFTQTSLIKARTQKYYTNTDNHFGTLRIKVRNGAQLRRRVLGAIESIAHQSI